MSKTTKKEKKQEEKKNRAAQMRGQLNREWQRAVFQIDGAMVRVREVEKQFAECLQGIHERLAALESTTQCLPQLVALLVKKPEHKKAKRT